MDIKKVKNHILGFREGDGCSCHNNPPCGFCTDPINCLVADIADSIENLLIKEDKGTFNIKLESVEKPLTFLDKKLNDVTDAYIVMFGKLAQEYAQSIGQIKAIAIKDGTYNDPINIDNLHY